MGLGLRFAVLIAVLALLFTDSRCAEHRRAPKKPTDPHYKYQQHYDYKRDDDYDRKGYYDGYDRVKDYGRKGYDDYDKKPYNSYGPPYGKKDYKGYGGYDSYAGYEDADYRRDGYYDDNDYDGHKHKKKEPKLAGHVKLDVDTCAVKFPGAAPDTDNLPLTLHKSLKDLNLTDLLDYISRPSTVVGRLSVSCKHRSHPYGYDSYDSYGNYDSYDSYDSYGGYDSYHDYGDGRHNKTTSAGELGTCYFKGITDDCIKYKYNVTENKDYPAFITFICTLDAAEAKRCDPALRACSGEKILIGGHGRVTIRYTTSHTFSILPDTFVEDLLVTGIYNGQAAGQGEPHNLLPLTRYNVGKAKFHVTGCRNANAIAATPGWPDDCGKDIHPDPGSDTPADGFIELDLTI